MSEPKYNNGEKKMVAWPEMDETVPQPPVANLGDGYFWIDRICGKRIRNGLVEYHMKWYGYSKKHNTWEKSEHLMQDVPLEVGHFEWHWREGLLPEECYSAFEEDCRREGVDVREGEWKRRTIAEGVMEAGEAEDGEAEDDVSVEGGVREEGALEEGTGERGAGGESAKGDCAVTAGVIAGTSRPERGKQNNWVEKRHRLSCCPEKISDEELSGGGSGGGMSSGYSSQSRSGGTRSRGRSSGNSSKGKISSGEMSHSISGSYRRGGNASRRCSRRGGHTSIHNSSGGRRDSSSSNRSGGSTSISSSIWNENTTSTDGACHSNSYVMDNSHHEGVAIDNEEHGRKKATGNKQKESNGTLTKDKKHQLHYERQEKNYRDLNESRETPPIKNMGKARRHPRIDSPKFINSNENNIEDNNEKTLMINTEIESPYFSETLQSYDPKYIALKKPSSLSSIHERVENLVENAIESEKAIETHKSAEESALRTLSDAEYAEIAQRFALSCELIVSTNNIFDLSNDFSNLTNETSTPPSLEDSDHEDDIIIPQLDHVNFLLKIDDEDHHSIKRNSSQANKPWMTRLHVEPDDEILQNANEVASTQNKNMSADILNSGRSIMINSVDTGDDVRVTALDEKNSGNKSNDNISYTSGSSKTTLQLRSIQGTKDITINTSNESQISRRRFAGGIKIKHTYLEGSQDEYKSNNHTKDYYEGLPTIDEKGSNNINNNDDGNNIKAPIEGEEEICLTEDGGDDVDDVSDDIDNAIEEQQEKEYTWSIDIDISPERAPIIVLSSDEENEYHLAFDKNLDCKMSEPHFQDEECFGYSVVVDATAQVDESKLSNDGFKKQVDDAAEVCTRDLHEGMDDNGSENSFVMNEGESKINDKKEVDEGIPMIDEEGSNIINNNDDGKEGDEECFGFSVVVDATTEVDESKLNNDGFKKQVVDAAEVCAPDLNERMDNNGSENSFFMNESESKINNDETDDEVIPMIEEEGSNIINNNDDGKEGDEECFGYSVVVDATTEVDESKLNNDGSKKQVVDATVLCEVCAPDLNEIMDDNGSENSFVMNESESKINNDETDNEGIPMIDEEESNIINNNDDGKEGDEECFGYSVIVDVTTEVDESKLNNDGFKKQVDDAAEVCAHDLIEGMDDNGPENRFVMNEGESNDKRDDDGIDEEGSDIINNNDDGKEDDHITVQDESNEVQKEEEGAWSIGTDMSPETAPIVVLSRDQDNEPQENIEQPIDVSKILSPPEPYLACDTCQKDTQCALGINPSYDLKINNKDVNEGVLTDNQDRSDIYQQNSEYISETNTCNNPNEETPITNSNDSVMNHEVRRIPNMPGYRSTIDYYFYSLYNWHQWLMLNCCCNYQQRSGFITEDLNIGENVSQDKNNKEDTNSNFNNSVENKTQNQNPKEMHLEDTNSGENEKHYQQNSNNEYYHLGVSHEDRQSDAIGNNQNYQQYASNEHIPCVGNQENQKYMNENRRMHPNTYEDYLNYPVLYGNKQTCWYHNVDLPIDYRINLHERKRLDPPYFDENVRLPQEQIVISPVDLTKNSSHPKEHFAEIDPEYINDVLKSTSESSQKQVQDADVNLSYLRNFAGCSDETNLVIDEMILEDAHATETNSISVVSNNIDPNNEEIDKIFSHDNSSKTNDHRLHNGKINDSQENNSLVRDEIDQIKNDHRNSIDHFERSEGNQSCKNVFTADKASEDSSIADETNETVELDKEFPENNNEGKLLDCAETAANCQNEKKNLQISEDNSEGDYETEVYLVETNLVFNVMNLKDGNGNDSEANSISIVNSNIGPNREEMVQNYSNDEKSNSMIHGEIKVDGIKIDHINSKAPTKGSEKKEPRKKVLCSENTCKKSSSDYETDESVQLGHLTSNFDTESSKYNKETLGESCQELIISDNTNNVNKNLEENRKPIRKNCAFYSSSSRNREYLFANNKNACKSYDKPSNNTTPNDSLKKCIYLTRINDQEETTEIFHEGGICRNEDGHQPFTNTANGNSISEQQTVDRNQSTTDSIPDAQIEAQEKQFYGISQENISDIRDISQNPPKDTDNDSMRSVANKPRLVKYIRFSDILQTYRAYDNPNLNLNNVNDEVKEGIMSNNNVIKIKNTSKVLPKRKYVKKFQKHLQSTSLSAENCTSSKAVDGSLSKNCIHDCTKSENADIKMGGAATKKRKLVTMVEITGKRFFELSQNKADKILNPKAASSSLAASSPNVSNNGENLPAKPKRRYRKTVKTSDETDKDASQKTCYEVASGKSDNKNTKGMLKRKTEEEIPSFSHSTKISKFGIHSVNESKKSSLDVLGHLTNALRDHDYNTLDEDNRSRGYLNIPTKEELKQFYDVPSAEYILELQSDQNSERSEIFEAKSKELFSNGENSNESDARVHVNIPKSEDSKEMKKMKEIIRANKRLNDNTANRIPVIPIKMVKLQNESVDPVGVLKRDSGAIKLEEATIFQTGRKAMLWRTDDTESSITSIPKMYTENGIKIINLGSVDATSKKVTPEPKRNSKLGRKVTNHGEEDFGNQKQNGIKILPSTPKINSDNGIKMNDLLTADAKNGRNRPNKANLLNPGMTIPPPIVTGNEIIPYSETRTFVSNGHSTILPLYCTRPNCLLVPKPMTKNKLG